MLKKQVSVLKIKTELTNCSLQSNIKQ